jgi:energy-coupling factor transport system ATP-binding protein
VLGARAAELADAGVWVPGIPPAVPPPPLPRGDLLRAGAAARVRGVPVATGIDLEVRAGEVLAITGPNGAGKSTLGLTLAGLLHPASGELSASAPLAAGAAPAPIAWRSRELLTRIGTVFQDPEHQLLARSVRGELEVGPRALGMDEAACRPRRRAAGAAAADALAAANPYTLSGGEKRRLTVAAVLATAPRVLVLDEPTFGQDARTWAELVALLARLRDDGSAIVAITHDEAVVDALHARRFALGAERHEPAAATPAPGPASSHSSTRSPSSPPAP